LHFIIHPTPVYFLVAHWKKGGIFVAFAEKEDYILFAFYFLGMMQKVYFVMPACSVIYELKLLVLALLPAAAYNDDIVSSADC
jgi:hypothetical protein